MGWGTDRSAAGGGRRPRRLAPRGGADAVGHRHRQRLAVEVAVGHDRRRSRRGRPRGPAPRARGRLAMAAMHPIGPDSAARTTTPRITRKRRLNRRGWRTRGGTGRAFERHHGVVASSRRSIPGGAATGGPGRRRPRAVGWRRRSVTECSSGGRWRRPRPSATAAPMRQAAGDRRAGAGAGRRLRAVLAPDDRQPRRVGPAEAARRPDCWRARPRWPAAYVPAGAGRGGAAGRPARRHRGHAGDPAREQDRTVLRRMAKHPALGAHAQRLAAVADLVVHRQLAGNPSTPAGAGGPVPPRGPGFPGRAPGPAGGRLARRGRPSDRLR